MSWPKFKETECPPLETSRFPSSSVLVVAIVETIIPISRSYGTSKIVMYKNKNETIYPLTCCITIYLEQNEDASHRPPHGHIHS